MSPTKQISSESAREQGNGKVAAAHVLALVRHWRRAAHSGLFAGVSLAAMMLVAPDATARNLGKSSSGPSEAAIEAAKNAQTEAAKAGARAQNALKRATQSIQAVQSSQKAVRDWARNQLKSGIPDGLAPGGLQVAPGSNPDAVWIGSKDPTSAKVGDITKVTIEQKQQKSILTWETFNISENTELRYDQKGNRDWVSLNRVLDPSAAPSRILGSITADGTVLVMNRNGIVFGAGSQINVGTLMATTLDVGPAFTLNSNGDPMASTIAWRNQNFLNNGLLGYETLTFRGSGNEGTATFSALGGSNDGTVLVEKGANITVRPNGTILLAAPHVINAGHLVASQGQVILTAAETALTLTESKGTGTDAIRETVQGALDSASGGNPEFAWAAPDANIRGYVPLPQGKRNRSDYFVWNQDSGLIEAPQGNIYLRSPGNSIMQPRPDNGGGHTIGFGAAYNDGILSSTTSVARNGSVFIDGGDIRLGKNSQISILVDTGTDAITQDKKSIAAFKTSAIRIGRNAELIVMEEDSLIVAPSAKVQIGRAISGELMGAYGGQEIVLKSGAEINVAGLLDVLVPISENQVVIDPAKKNELRDSPIYRLGFLNGAVIYLDPRKSGVRDDGVAWIGSPLIDAQAYNALVSVGADRLMTKGGTVRIGTSSYLPSQQVPGVRSVIIRDGATIDISGGSVKYEGGMIRSTQLVDSLGNVVDISRADPGRTYVGIASGFTRSSKRWGITETWANPFGRADRYYVGGYDEGRDAGALSIDAGSLAFDGKLFAQAHASLKQIVDGKAGTGSSGIYGDMRRVQGANSELPAGGALIIHTATDIEVRDSVSPLGEGGSYGRWTGGSIISDGLNSTYQRPVLSGDPPLPAGRLGTVLLSDDLLSNSGLSQVTLFASSESKDDLDRVSRFGFGEVRVSAGANIRLNDGGVFRAQGTRLQIDGNVTAPSGRITLKTLVKSSPAGTDFSADAKLGDHDIVVNGALNVAGRWVNDFRTTDDTMAGRAWLNGGTIEMEAASNILKLSNIYNPSNPQLTTLIVSDGARGVLIERDANDQPTEPIYEWQKWKLITGATAEDISGRIQIASGAELNLSGGGRVGTDGKLDLSGKGGNLSLKSSTSYMSGNGFRVLTELGGRQEGSITINPERINARVSFDPASIKAHGFGGGGKFTLVTPEFSIGEGSAEVGTRLPLDFFSKAGFSSYDITSNKTVLKPTAFNSGFGGYDAYGAVQTITVGAGQTLSLAQSVLPNLLSEAQAEALRALQTGGDVNSIVSASVPVDAYDQKAVSLRLGGMLELHVAKGGKIEGAAGSSVTVSGLFNEGAIRIAGGRIMQDSTSPFMITLNEKGPYGNSRDPIGFRDLSDVFTVNPDGTIDPNAISKVRDQYGNPITNGKLVGDNYAGSGPDLATARRLFKLGVLDQEHGILLAAGSVTDLSGAVVLNPRAMGGGRPIRDGRIVGGGFLGTIATQMIDGNYHAGGRFTAEAGARIDLSGAAGMLDRVVQNGNNLLGVGSYGAVPVWSDGGTLLVSEGGTFAGATILAHGGSDKAHGGTLDIADPVFTQHDSATPAQNVISNDMIQAAGFDTLVARGRMTSSGNATVALDRAFYLIPKTWKYGNTSVGGAEKDVISPTISTGGALRIDAPYIALQNVLEAPPNPVEKPLGGGSVTFSARQIDLTGGIRFDYSVANAALDSTGDIRFLGVDPVAWQRHIGTIGAVPEAPTLKGGLAVQGDLSIKAAQIYPTTGTSFTITSGGPDATIRIGRSGGVTPPVPYSAGGNLAIQAAHIEQGGVIRVPFGTLTLGGNSPIKSGTQSWATTLVPATKSVVLADGSITSVSAGGLSIPYGTTTDTLEWYFSPTNLSALTGPPAKVLSLSGDDITLAKGATVDLTGGGDVYAYEFVPGTGGSRDILNQFNSDEYSATYIDGVGYQYPGGRQVYAIVPGLSDAPAAAYDPIYSANYGDLSSVTGVGRRVWLDGGNGLKAGWYTLLPAQYAMLPGGMRVVEQTDVKYAAPGSSYKRPDGTVLVSGYYGDALSGAAESNSRQFSVMSQDGIRSYSNIVLTSGNDFAYKEAAKKGLVVPRTGLDAGRLVLNPLSNMRIDTVVSSASAKGGRGSQVDIAGSRIEIVSQAGTPSIGVIKLAVGSLNNLNAESLLIGGTRTDNTDGTTNLNITANSIVVANDAANPLIAPEIVLAVDNIAFAADGSVSPVGSSLVLNEGATLIATGTLSDKRSGAYVIDGTVAGTTSSSGLTTYSTPANTTIGAMFRVANGPQRVVNRLRTPSEPGGNPGTPTGPNAKMVIGNVNVSGGSIGLDTSHDISIGSAAKLAGRDIALGVTRLAFTSGAASSGTVVITPELQAILSQGDRLTLRSQTSIGFDNGSYGFKAVKFDTSVIESLAGGSVSLSGDRIELGNSGAAGVAIGGGGSRLAIDAGEFIMGSGTIGTVGFGNGVKLTARNGLFSNGQNGVLEVGAANLDIVAPYMGDRGTHGVSTDAPTGMSFRTTGNVAITSAGTTPIDLTRYPGIPGSSLSIDGNNITIAGTHLRATAGALTVKAQGAIALSGAATIEAPGYERTFGDAADPKIKSAAGGTVTLAANGSGGIGLGNARLSVGNGRGSAGKLKLSSQNGVIDWGTASLDGRGGTNGQGGSFAIDTAGAIDLVSLNTRVGADGFTSGFDVRTRVGDIVLNAGQTLSSGAVNLTADGGSVIVSGTIDTSGVNGGDIALYGAGGVTLRSTALLDAHANGYAADDTRRAKAGNVILGTDFTPGSATIGNDGVVSGTSGFINVAAGARIDVSAKRPGDRLVRIMRNGVANYAYVESDQGGTVTFRAPVIGNGSGADTVNVVVVAAQSVVGARAIDLVGFKRWDLAKVAESGLYKGVKYDAVTNTVTLDVAEDLDTATTRGGLTSVGGVNFLGDEDNGTIPHFVQNFDVSAAYATLGGLATQANFHARPGLDLAHTGKISLKSNWNLGAGRVDLVAAQAAGHMRIVPELQVAGLDTSGYVVKVGSEAELFEKLTKFTYRTKGGDVRGEAPVLNLRAGSDLELKGSLTDGFFMFRDQSDLTYRSMYLGSGITRWNNFLLSLNGGLLGNDGYSAPLTDWAAWNGTGTLNNYLGLSLSTRTSNWLVQSNVASIPYTAVGNSPAARGTFVADAIGNVDGGGDPVGSAEVFPLFQDGTAAQSSSYALVAGAANLASGTAARVSADPARVAAASSASISVEGSSTYQVSGGRRVSPVKLGGIAVDNNLSYSATTGRPSATGINAAMPVSMAEWLAWITSPNFSSVRETSVAVLNIGSSTTSNDDPNRGLVIALFQAFAAEKGLVRNETGEPHKGYRYSSTTATDGSTTFIAMTVKNFKAFVTEKLIPALGQVEANLNAAAATEPTRLPTPVITTPQGIKTLVQPLIRTGTGSIAMSAAGDVDLTGGAVKYLSSNGALVAAPTASTLQVGGVAVYTVGHRVGAFTKTLTDPVTGVAVTISTPAGQSSNFNRPADYSYAAGVVVADPVALTGGGDVSVAAQGSVLSRRNEAQSFVAGAGWIGANAVESSNRTAESRAPAQPWRIVNMDIEGRVDASINPQLFQEGIGTLGGGDIRITAGGEVSDLSAVSQTSLRSTTAAPQGLDASNVLLQWGGGSNVVVRAGRDVIANRIDVASGSLLVAAGGRIGESASMGTGRSASTNEMRVRIDDATVDLMAGSDITIAGIKQLDGFYTDASALNLLANGSVTITNTLQTAYGDGRSFVGYRSYAVYPGTLTVASLTGDVNLLTTKVPVGATINNNDPNNAPASYNPFAPNAILMAPNSQGQLSLLAGGDIGATKLAMLDMDPYYLPGLFTLGGSVIDDIPFGGILPPNAGYQWGSVGFPSVKSNLSDTLRRRQHAKTPVHANNPNPVYVYAGRDIGSADISMTLSVPKQARVHAGRDIVNMVFMGQNLAKDDLTRVVAGRDMVGTVTLARGSAYDPTRPPAQRWITTPSNPTVKGNTFLLGGPGNLMLEAGRNMGPFLNSAEIYDPASYTNPPIVRYAGGIVTIGNDWNPYLPPESANITVQFGVSKGADYGKLRDAYVKPGTEANSVGGYGAKLVAWMKQYAAETLSAEYGNTEVSADEAYAAFLKLPELRQRGFLIDVVYFGELRAPSDPDGSSYLKYSRGYAAVNTLFPAGRGYTANGLEGGAKSGDVVSTGDLDLRLAAIETVYGGNINILGPGGRVVAGSVVATSQQAARRNFAGASLYRPSATQFGIGVSGTVAIPAGYEGVITQRGGYINTFTDGDFILNQSRLFTVDGGDVTMWSSNADLNAGQGAKTTPNFPPVAVRMDENMVVEEDPSGSTTGAGIAAFPPRDKKKPRPKISLLAPRGTVDAGDAGVRADGGINVAALMIANADNFKAGGAITGIPTIAAPNIGGLTEASNTAAAAADQIKPDQNNANEQPSVIIVEVLGFGGGDGGSRDEDDERRKAN